MMKIHLLVFTFILVTCICPAAFSQKCTEKVSNVIVVTNAYGPKIISKPEPEYTEEARRHGTMGIVVLRGLFHRSGKVMNVCWVTSLPDGLTENAIKAAYQITFEPV